MTSPDLPERLREHAHREAGGGPNDITYDPETLALEIEAADEIDRLRSLVTDLLNADDWQEGSGDRGPWVEARRAAEQAHREWIGGRP